MSEVSPHPPSKPDLTDIDLYCLHCGYNLRGLSGDPRRCPECGHLNPVGDLELPAEAIAAQLRRMETNPAVCVGMALISGVFLVMFVFALVRSPPGTPLMDVGCFMVPMLISAGVWVFCVFGFRRFCRARPGWGGALWRYHVYAALLCALVGLVGLGPVIVFTFSGARVGRQGYVLFVFGVIVALVIAVRIIFTVGWRVHRRLKEIMRPLQREVAVTVAREILRRRLVRGQLW